MIPHTLQLKNFLSYGDEIQTIDFSPYQLICLSGKNGHGKSALLDAMTWALWGNARKTTGTAKADQGLLRLGQTHMMVIFDFELNNIMYRVKREFALTHGKPYANLEFGIINTKTGEFNALTDKKIRATQDKIEHTLHLTFDAFSNSAFLRQGNANEFSNKSPKERKEIFANILGLNQYDELRKRAMEKAKEASAHQKTLDAFQEKITQELSEKEALTQQLKAINQNLKQHETQTKTFAQLRAQLDKKQTQLRAQQTQLDLLLFEQKNIHKEQKTSIDVARTIFHSWRKTHHKQQQLPDQNQLKKEKDALSKAIAQHQQQLQKGLHLKEQYLTAKEQLHTITQQHQTLHSKQVQQLQLERERTATQHKVMSEKQAELGKTLAQLNKEITVIDTKTISAQQAQFEKRKACYQQWVAQGNWLRDQALHLTQKNDFIHDEQDPSCPLCEQNLSASRKRFLRDKFEREQRVVNHQLARLKRVIAKLKPMLITQHETIQKQLKTIELIKQKESIQKEQTIIAKTIKEYELLLQKHELAIKQADETSKQALLKNSDYTATARKIISLKKQAQEIKYDADGHKKQQEQLKTIEQQLAHYATIEKECALQDERLKQFDTHRTAYKQATQRLATLAKKIKQFDTIAKQHDELTTQDTQLRTQEKDHAQHKEQLLQEKGKLENQKALLEKRQKEFDEHKKSLKTLTKEIDDYQLIAAATGKNGLQALLIEEAIPEVEQEANELLAKLTDNQAQIFIESLRDLKKGGTKETLDIKISDAAGIRPYEMFSGGEAFRIDFALRIALSKLLARRAGTALQTLIIDEGFGSQDEEGLTNIMDAIYKIQDDFCKVIIVSHLPTMKNQFPIHFFVQKGAHGSSVRVIEQG